MIPQDIGRVILNLITNAFYASKEKKKTTKDPDFKPTVSVSTKRADSPLGAGGELSKQEFVKIIVKDNGNGIPGDALDKIFQPFFTTKPTGEGTGLGLSMSYDIVTKGHGGKLKVEIEEARPDDPVGRGKGTIFTIILPYDNNIA
jgi:signal transduction histidine kinase